MQQVNSLAVQGTSAQLTERLRAIEEKLIAATAGSAVDSGDIRQVIAELQAIRAQWSAGSGNRESPQSRASGDTRASGEAAPRAAQDASLDKAEEHDRMARAISELKSGEFDVQG